MENQTHVATTNTPLHHVAYPIVHPQIGAALEYRHLIKDTNLRDVWINSFANELGRLAQGRKSTNLEGTNTIF